MKLILNFDKQNIEMLIQIECRKPADLKIIYFQLKKPEHFKTM